MRVVVRFRKGIQPTKVPASDAGQRVWISECITDIRSISTPMLQGLMRAHAHDKLHVDLPVDQIYSILDELNRRRELEGSPFKSNEDAWADFVARYMPPIEDPRIPHELTPSLHGRECLGNGEWVGYDCCCDECDYALVCFPEFA